jgi:hypothetical protein
MLTFQDTQQLGVNNIVEKLVVRHHNEFSLAYGERSVQLLSRLPEPAFPEGQAPGGGA